MKLTGDEEVALIKKLRKVQTIGIRQVIKAKIISFLFGRSFTFFEKFGIHVLPVHYYSPIPDTRDLRKNLSRWYRESSFTGVNFHIEEQLMLLHDLEMYKLECNTLPPLDQVASKGYGEGYGEVEAHILHAMIRKLKPQTIIEVGAGVSTVFSANALRLNQRDSETNAKIICIEPYPRPQLIKLQGKNNIQVTPKLVQDVNVNTFKMLDKNDILFIDSSHIVKIDSDVIYLYLEVLPNLKEGVVIHVHDINFPYPTPAPDPWIFTRHQFWTESALLHAFLLYNSAFEILLSSRYLQIKEPDLFRSVFSIYDPVKHFPASIWLRKVR